VASTSKSQKQKTLADWGLQGAATQPTTGLKKPAGSTSINRWLSETRRDQPFHAIAAVAIYAPPPGQKPGLGNTWYTPVPR